MDSPRICNEFPIVLVGICYRLVAHCLQSRGSESNEYRQFKRDFYPLRSKYRRIYKLLLILCGNAAHNWVG